jgi:gas vesicle protein
MAPRGIAEGAGAVRDRGDLLVGLVLGGLLGALAGLLLAPAPGHETRRILGRRARAVGDRVRTGADALASRARLSAEEVLRLTRRRVDEALDTVQETIAEAAGPTAPSADGEPVGEGA